MAFDEPPVAAAWRHGHSRNGFEVADFARRDGGYEIRGSTVAVEGASIWSVHYELHIDHAWVTRRARVSSRRDGSACELTVDGHARYPGIAERAG